MRVVNKKIDLDQQLQIDINRYQLEFYDNLLDKKNRINIRIASLLSEKDELLTLYDAARIKNDSTYNYFSPNNLAKQFEFKKVKSDIKLITHKIKVFEKKLEETNEIIKRFELIQKYIQKLEQKENNVDKSGIMTDKYYDIENPSGLFLLKAQELERKRIALDLHDITLQNLTGLLHKTELISKLLDLDLNRSRVELQSVQEGISGVIKDMRDIIYDLRPMADDVEFSVSLNRLIKSFSKQSDINIELHIENYNSGILPIINITIYRIIQECCVNSIKHSEAKNLHINLSYGEDKIYLIIEDDGKGFDIKEMHANEENNITHFGLSIIQDRVFMLSGSIDINTKVGVGTRFDIVVPLIINLEG